MNDLFDALYLSSLSGTPYSATPDCSGPLEYAVKSMDLVLGRESGWASEMQTPIAIIAWTPSRRGTLGLVEAVGRRCFAYNIDDVLPRYTPITEEVSVEQSTARQETASSDPYEASRQLIDWIGITYTELAQITGIGRTTFFYWKRSRATPQARTLRPLWRIYSLAQAVRGALGQSGAQRWFNAGSPSPRELLLAGDFDEAESQAHRVVFQPTLMPRPTRFFGVGEEDLDLDRPATPVTTDGTRPRRAARKPTTRRLGPT